jgi:hypothetical protein
LLTAEIIIVHIHLLIILINGIAILLIHELIIKIGQIDIIILIQTIFSQLLVISILGA